MKAAEPAFPSGGTKYRGVSFMYKCARWRACLVVKGKPQHLGLFRNAKEAAIAYDAASLRTNGSPAVLNFDIDGNSTEHSTPGHGGLYGSMHSPQRYLHLHLPKIRQVMIVSMVQAQVIMAKRQAKKKAVVLYSLVVCLGHELEKNIIKYHQIKCLQWKSGLLLQV